jgi:hypothetical protein
MGESFFYILTSPTQPTTKYWQELAEERRAALESALKENLQMAQEVSFV